jgi:hypothetical protein
MGTGPEADRILNGVDVFGRFHSVTDGNRNLLPKSWNAWGVAASGAGLRGVILSRPAYSGELLERQDRGSNRHDLPKHGATIPKPRIRARMCSPNPDFVKLCVSDGERDPKLARRRSHPATAHGGVPAFQLNDYERPTARPRSRSPRVHLIASIGLAPTIRDNCEPASGRPSTGSGRSLHDGKRVAISPRSATKRMSREATRSTSGPGTATSAPAGS